MLGIEDVRKQRHDKTTLVAIIQCVNMNTRTGYTCKCLHGFKGNPYLLEGCKTLTSVQTTKHKDYNCPMQTHCANTEGSYLCVLNGERKRMSGLLIELALLLVF
ncbi:hypothetical protein OROMI_012011 [Orobanche minor]